jgi:hypothetical protein
MKKPLICPSGGSRVARAQRGGGSSYGYRRRKGVSEKKEEKEAGLQDGSKLRSKHIEWDAGGCADKKRKMNESECTL